MKRNAVPTMMAMVALVLFTGCPSPSGGDPVNPEPVVLSTNANLSNLTISDGTLSPVFDAETTTYSVYVATSVEAITVSGTPEDSTATVGGNNGIPQNLSVGENRIIINVRAQDAASMKQYVIYVGRRASAQAVSHGISMLAIPSGRFQRDSWVTNISSESAFKMSATEITRAQFTAVMGVDPGVSLTSSNTSDPVHNVSWYDAIAFCNKLSIAEGLGRVYDVAGFADDAAWTNLAYADIPTTDNADWNAVTATWTNSGYRLPTEMEWIWAAMGAPSDGQNGGTNTTGYAKAFAGSTGSNSLGAFAWYDDNSEGKFNPVGTKLPNELGLYDMNGNVAEWCWDWYAAYPSKEQTDYPGPVTSAAGTFRSLLGGSKVSEASSCTIVKRMCTSPYWADGGFYGFRVVRL